MASPKALFRWIAGEPRQFAWVVFVSVAAGLLAYGFLRLIGRESWDPWFITGVIMLAGGFVQPDLAPFENNRYGSKGKGPRDADNKPPPSP